MSFSLPPHHPSRVAGDEPDPALAPARSPDVIEPSAAAGRRVIAAALLAGSIGAGIGAGAVVFSGHLRGPIAEVNVNTAPVHGPGNEAIRAARVLAPSVATVVTTLSGNHFAEGSGFVFAHADRVSYLLTNDHVIRGATRLNVVMPGGRNLVATVIGNDSADDLAVISVPADLPQATFGDSAELQAGETVVAIGSPLGNEGSITEGVVSALHRSIRASDQITGATESLQDVLQIDVPINLGNSGGPLSDADGRVVGVNVALEPNANANGTIGYSIPGNLARAVGEDLIAHRALGHPYLGISFQTPVQAIESGHGFDGPGVYVDAVEAGGPAATAGCRTGDILEAIDGTPIGNGVTVGALLAGRRIGDAVDLRVRRDGRALQMIATLAARPASVSPTAGPTP